jgi:hypothetical protein
MRKFYLAITVLTLISAPIWATNLPVKVATDPVYPTADGSITISLNIKGTAFDTTKLDVYTGLITTQSTDIADSWKHVVPNSWGDHPDSLKLKRVNDSIYSFTISKISQFYNIAPNEGVFRITFIARDQSGNQTNNLYFEVFGNTPSDTVSTLPLRPTSGEILAVNLNLNKTTKTLKAYITSHPDSAVFAYTAVNTNLGDWQHAVSDWGNVAKNNNLKPIRVSDSIFRLFIQPSANTFYGVSNPAEAIKTLNFVFRNAAGDAQTEDIILPLVYTAPTIISEVTSYLCYPKYPTVNDKIFIYINANKYGFNPKSSLSAYTGVITSTSKDALNGWQYIINKDWTDMTFGLTKLNDSIHVFEISSVRNLYKTDPITDVFRIAFIARDSANGTVSKQTSNLYFEIYSGQPTGLFTTQPKLPVETKSAVITVNIKKSVKDLASHISATDTVFAYTAVTTNFGAWKYEVKPWGDVAKDVNLQTIRASDSIFRFYEFPNSMSFYKITDTCTHVKTANFVFRNAAGNAQIDDIIVPFDTTSYKECTLISVATTSISKLSIYPNPALDYIMVKSAENINDIFIVNIVGQKVVQLAHVNSNNASISLNNLEKGIYFVSVKTANNVTSIQKLIKR